MTIIQMQQELTDLRNELRTETQRGMDMIHQDGTTLEQMQAQSARVDDLQVRIALAQAALDAAQGNPPTPPAQTPQAPRNGGFASMGEFFAAVRSADTHNGRRDERLMRNAAIGVNETSPEEGGYLVPPEYAAGIIDQMHGESILYPQARKVVIQGNRLIERYLAETNRKASSESGGTRHGGVLAYWKNEADQYTASKPNFGERTTQLDKLTAYIPVTEEMLEDYAAIESYLGSLVGREFAYKMDDAILNGDGKGTMPLGMLATDNKALVTIAKESSQAAKTVNLQNLLKMYNAMPARYRAGAKWYINQDVELQLMSQMLNTVNVAAGDSATNVSCGGPLWLPAGAYGNENGKLLGADVIPLEQSPALGAAGDILFANAGQYLIVERTGLKQTSSIHVRFDYDETVFKFALRVGGRPEWMSTITGDKSTTARSPYVTLAARA